MLRSEGPQFAIIFEDLFVFRVGGVRGRDGVLEVWHKGGDIVKETGIAGYCWSVVWEGGHAVVAVLGFEGCEPLMVEEVAFCEGD
jgi:hypothetical protein